MNKDGYESRVAAVGNQAAAATYIVIEIQSLVAALCKKKEKAPGK